MLPSGLALNGMVGARVDSGRVFGVGSNGTGATALGSAIVGSWARSPRPAIPSQLHPNNRADAGQAVIACRTPGRKKSADQTHNRGHLRLPETTPETVEIRLITRRSRVQIPAPPLQKPWSEHCSARALCLGQTSNGSSNDF